MTILNLDYIIKNMANEKRTKILFEELFRLGPLSNQELAETFDLSPASITHLVHPLVEDKMLIQLSPETYPEIKTQGKEIRRRRKATFTANPDFGYFIVLNVKPSSLELYKVNFSLDLDTKSHETLETGNTQTLLDSLVGIIERIRKMDSRPLLAVGICISGRADRVAGRTIFTNSGSEHFTITLARAIEHKFGIPCVLENDANALAVFERFKGNAKEINNFLCLFIEEGVGLGIFANGALYEGHHHLAGEAGHYILDSQGLNIRGRPRGSFENYVSTQGIHRELAELGIQIPKDAVYGTLQNWLNGSPHSEVEIVYEKIISRTALLCANLTHLLAPDCIFIYGPLSELGMGFSQPLKHEMMALTTMDRESYIEKAIVARNNALECMTVGTAKTALDRYLLAELVL